VTFGRIFTRGRVNFRFRKKKVPKKSSRKLSGRPKEYKEFASKELLLSCGSLGRGVEKVGKERKSLGNGAKGDTLAKKQGKEDLRHGTDRKDQLRAVHHQSNHAEIEDSLTVEFSRT